jgi:GH43 family beta-xylosidase
VTVPKDTTPIVFTKPEVMREVWLNPSPSLNDVQNMINSALERQAKSTDELLRRLIEERDGKKLDTTSTNPSSSTCAVNFTQINPHTSGPSAGGTSIPNPSTQPMNHFHSRTTIKDSTPNLWMPQQATTNMYGQWYTHTTPNFAIPNPL